MQRPPGTPAPKEHQDLLNGLYKDGTIRDFDSSDLGLDRPGERAYVVWLKEIPAPADADQ